MYIHISSCIQPRNKYDWPHLSFKLLTEKAICTEDYTIHLLMWRAWHYWYRQIAYWSQWYTTTRPDELHLVKLYLIDVQIQVKYNNCSGKIFISEIEQVWGLCDVGLLPRIHKMFVWNNFPSEVSSTWPPKTATGHHCPSRFFICYHP